MDLLLGKAVVTPGRYSPEVLCRVARHGEGLEGACLAPCGWDVWHAYEASCLTESGVPVVCVLKLAYPSASEWIVESKSLKLYLNSLNGETMGATPSAACGGMVERVRGDLSRLLETEVHCCAHTAYSGEFDFSDYSSVDGLGGGGGVGGTGAVRYSSALLRSRCPVTGQPDWGNVFVRMRGVRLPLPGDLLRYVVSLREEQHFHEAICNATYAYLWAHYAPEALMVSCLYTRRGGIDICPVRSTLSSWLPGHLVDVARLTAPAWRQ